MPTSIPVFEPGFRLIDGSQLNRLVDRLNAIANTNPFVVGQGAVTALTVSATLTGAQLGTGILTALQGAGAVAAYQLPTAAAMNLAFPTIQIGQAFDFALINISVVAAEIVSITTNTGWTLVGSMTVVANDAAANRSVGQFRARKTGATTWTLYRIS